MQIQIYINKLTNRWIGLTNCGHFVFTSTTARNGRDASMNRDEFSVILWHFDTFIIGLLLQACYHPLLSMLFVQFNLNFCLAILRLALQTKDLQGSWDKRAIRKAKEIEVMYQRERRSRDPEGDAINNEYLFHASEILVISHEISIFVYEEITRELGHPETKAERQEGGREGEKRRVLSRGG